MKQLIGLALMAMSALAHAGVTYTYTGSSTNLIPTPNGPDHITLSFTVAAALFPNSVYNIGVSASSETLSWAVSDAMGYINVSNGPLQPISIATYPGLIEGGGIYACALPCFGGAVQTNAQGGIFRWNLIAPNIVSYNTLGLGSIDGVTPYPVFGVNTLNGTTGSWSVSPVPEPSTWVLMMAGSALSLLVPGRNGRQPGGRS